MNTMYVVIACVLAFVLGVSVGLLLVAVKVVAIKD